MGDIFIVAMDGKAMKLHAPHIPFYQRFKKNPHLKYKQNDKVDNIFKEFFINYLCAARNKRTRNRYYCNLQYQLVQLNLLLS